MVPFALRTGPSIWNSKNHKVYMVRGMTGAGFVMCFFPGVALMEIADAQALTFTTPLFGMMLAMMFLGERFHVNRVFALLAGSRRGVDYYSSGFSGDQYWRGSGLVFCALCIGEWGVDEICHAFRCTRQGRVLSCNLHDTPYPHWGALRLAMAQSL